MLINFEDDYWKSPLHMLVAKHVFDLIANTIDLTAFSKRSLEITKFRLPFDFLSLVLIIAVQAKLFNAEDEDVNSDLSS